MARNQASQQYARKRTIEKRGNRCECCKQTGYVELHHIVEVINGGDNSDSNLQLLCYPCHQKAHGNKIGKRGQSFAAFVGNEVG